jgi:hypothetical protein
MCIVFTPSQSHNKIEWEYAQSRGYGQWWSSWVPTKAWVVDVSHNLLRPVLGTVLLGGESYKFPELQRVDLSYNSLPGAIATGTPGEHYNFDLSFNNLSGIDIGFGGVFSASTYMRQMTVVDWRNQLTPGRFGGFSSIDDALNSSVDFRTVDFLPRLNSFEQVEYPKGSGETPFSCPTW